MSLISMGTELKFGMAVKARSFWKSESGRMVLQLVAANETLEGKLDSTRRDRFIEVAVGGQKVVEARDVGAADEGVPFGYGTGHGCFDSGGVGSVEWLDGDRREVVEELLKQRGETTLLGYSHMVSGGLTIDGHGFGIAVQVVERVGGGPRKGVRFQVDG